MRTRSIAAGRAGRLVVFLAVVALVLASFTVVRSAGATDTRSAVARLVSAAVEISPPLAREEAGEQMVPRGSVLTHAGKLRPAADLGSWARSRGYVRVTPELGDALAEGSAPDATTREWTRCYEKGNAAYVICPDGFIEVN